MSVRSFVIVMLILVLLILPAQGYTDLASVELQPGGSTSACGNYGDGKFSINIRDMQSFCGNVTRVELTGSGYRGANISGSIPTRVWHVTAGYVGNATVSWDWTAQGTYSASWEVDIDFDDLDGKTVQGETALKFSDVPWANTFCHKYGSKWTGFDTPYSATLSSDFWNGTYLIQGGKPSPNVAFSCTPTDGVKNSGPVRVDCYDESTGGSVSDWFWTVESAAGGTNMQWLHSGTPTFYLSEISTYNVSLTVYSSGEGATLTKPDYITIREFSEGNYSIDLDPLSLKFGGATSGLIIGNLSKITAYRWYIYYPGQAMPDDFYETGTYRTLNYVDRTGTWMGWDDDTRDFSNNKGGTMPNPVNLYPKYSGQNLLVGCFIFLDDGSMVNPTARLTVGDGQGLQKITFIAEDAETGSFVSPVTYSILRHSTGSWQNLSEVRPGQVDVEYPTSSTLTAYAYPPAGSEYSVGSITYQVWDTPGYSQGVHIDMWKGASTNVSETTAYLSVIKNDGWAKIPGASIQLSDGQSCTTPSTGTCKLTLQNSTSYSATVSATGYHTNTFYFFVEGAGYQRAFQMVQIGATATPTLTIPVTTPPGGGGTPTPTGTGIVPGGVPTLNPSQKRQAVDKAGAIWFEYAEFLSYLIFLAVVFTILGTFEWKRRRGGKK